MGYVKQKPCYMVPIVFAAIVLIITIFFNSFEQVFAPDSLGQDIKLFQNNISYISRKYDLNVTPADWTFTIWIFIFTAQIVWVVYSLILLCRENRQKTGMLYYDPPFLPPSFFLIYSTGLLLTIAWLFIFDREFLVASFVTILGTYLSIQICIFFAVRFLWAYQNRLGKADMWLNIILVHNGLAMLGEWLFVASAVGLGIMLRYTFNVDMNIVGFILLTLILLDVVIYVPIDLFMLSMDYTRYLITPYLVIIVAMAGIVEKNWDPDSPVQIYAVFVLGLSGVAFILKLVSIIYYRLNRPLSIEVSN